MTSCIGQLNQLLRVVIQTEEKINKSRATFQSKYTTDISAKGIIGELNQLIVHLPSSRVLLSNSSKRLERFKNFQNDKINPADFLDFDVLEFPESVNQNYLGVGQTVEVKTDTVSNPDDFDYHSDLDYSSHTTNANLDENWKPLNKLKKPKWPKVVLTLGAKSVKKLNKTPTSSANETQVTCNSLQETRNDSSQQSKKLKDPELMFDEGNVVKKTSSRVRKKTSKKPTQKKQKNLANYRRNLNAKTKGRNFFCSECGTGFFTTKHLHQHKIRVHERRFQRLCETCGFSCATNWSYHNHMRTHKDSTQHTCYFCYFRSPRLDTLYAHMQNKHTKERRLCCKLCAFKHFTLKKLNRHTKRHTTGYFLANPDIPPEKDNASSSEDEKIKKPAKIEDRDKVCSDCGKGFTTKAYLRRHRASVHNRQYKKTCEKCGFVCANMWTYKKHVKRHQKPHYHSCYFCKLRFLRLDYLEQHVHTHTKESAHRCSKCKFTTCSTLKMRQHVRGHEDQVKALETEASLKMKSSWMKVFIQDKSVQN